MWFLPELQTMTRWMETAFEAICFYEFEGPKDGNVTRTQRPKLLKCAHVAKLWAEVE